MDAVKFLNEKNRMCKSFGNFCDGCEIYNKNDEFMSCDKYIETYPEQAVEIVEKWSKEHSQETRLSQFLKYYPNAPLDMYGIPHACVKDLGIVEYEYLCSDDCTDCPDCWNTPIEEE
jgi:hypothetical protein